jgi:hypothetical protein
MNAEEVGMVLAALQRDAVALRALADVIKESGHDVAWEQVPVSDSLYLWRVERTDGPTQGEIGHIIVASRSAELACTYGPEGTPIRFTEPERWEFWWRQLGHQMTYARVMVRAELLGVAERGMMEGQVLSVRFLIPILSDMPLYDEVEAGTGWGEDAEWDSELEDDGGGDGNK